MKIDTCPYCCYPVKNFMSNFESEFLTKNGETIIIPNVNYYQCTNDRCKFTFLDWEEEQKVEQLVDEKRK